ncbi:MAG TPA: ROK family protein, partial [Rectinemataceae bacterium]|nr:ROK family protein [Rectinemataceae bacterium]
MMKGLFAGLDIGGQSIKGIVLDEKGSVRREASRVTPSSSGAEAVLDAVHVVVNELLQAGALASVGVGTPGGVDREGVIVGMAANISGWYGTRLGDAVSSMAGAPCGVRNDGNIAAYAEWAARGGRAKALLFAGLGTGIGGGYVEDGRILGGCDDRALEIGHFVIEPEGRLCVCGVRGCSEAYASGLSIGKIAYALARGEDAGLGSLARAAGNEPSSPVVPGALIPSFPGSGLAARARSGELLNAKEVYDAYSLGDTLALAVDAIEAESLARTVATALALLAPDLVVLGGGVILGAPHLPGRVAEIVPRYVYSDAWKHCRFEAARLSH